MYNTFNEDKYVITHSFNTRSKHLTKPKFQRLTVTQQALSYTGPKQWNSLPQNIREAKSLSIFKSKLKKTSPGFL